MTEERKNEIVRAYLELGTYKKVHEKTGASLRSICEAIKEAGIGKGIGGNQTHIKVTDEQIQKDIDSGLSRKEIADKNGIHVANLDRRMRKLGSYAVHKKPNRKKLDWHYTKNGEEFVKKYQGDSFEFVGYKNGTFRLKCKKCGITIERARATINYKKVKCEECEEKQAAVKSLIKVLNAAIIEKTPHICKCCGKEFYSKYESSVYCSERCKKKQKKKSGNYRKRCRKYNVLYDGSVRRDFVLNRDGYKCQICGKDCNEEDKRWGSFGPDYPTLDHIIPLAKGGTHTIENVQCVCAMCNSQKRDLYEEMEGAS